MAGGAGLGDDQVVGFLFLLIIAGNETTTKLLANCLLALQQWPNPRAKVAADPALAKGVNVLEDAELRQGIKEYTNWPTIPQLYVKGEFVGGCDIVREMFQSGELATHMADAGLPVKQAAAG